MKARYLAAVTVSYNFTFPTDQPGASCAVPVWVMRTNFARTGAKVTVV